MIHIVLITGLWFLLKPIPRPNPPQITASAVSSGVIDLDAAQAKALLDSGKAIGLDVRTQGEWDAGFIADAVHCPISDPDFEAELAKIDHGKPYVVY